MRCVASLRETPSARLNDVVTEGNNPVWLTASGVVLAWLLATVSRGTLPLCRVQVDVFQSLGTLPILRRNFEHNVILIQLRVDDGNFRLAKCAV